MNLKRTATIVVVGGALAAWLAGAATSTRRQPPAPLVIQPPAVDLRGAELANEIARLRDRLRPDLPPRHGRNLFQFASSRTRAVPMVEKPVVVEPSEAAPAPLPVPTLKLVGVAEDPGPDGPIRTAIVSGLGQLFLVKEGDNVTLRYRVAKISAEVVELTDLGDGSPLRLALR